MMPPPKPLTSDETVTCAVEKGPRDASRMALVGFGPRSYGFSAACAAVGTTIESAKAATVVTKALAVRDVDTSLPPCSRGLISAIFYGYAVSLHRRNHRSFRRCERGRRSTRLTRHEDVHQC